MQPIEPMTIAGSSSGASVAPPEGVGWFAMVAAVASMWVWQVQWLVPTLGRFGSDIACLGPTAMACGWIAVDPRRRMRAATFLVRACSTSRGAFFTCTLLLMGAIKVYAVPGLRELDGDGACHTTAARLVADSLAAREWPTWSNAWAMGFPFLQFYPPLFAWLSGAITWVSDDPRFAVRLVLALAHLASGWGAFALGRRLLGRPDAALACAIGYALTPWHLFEVFHWNRFPTALIWALLPWVLWIFELGRDGARWVFPCGLLLAITALAHHGCALFVGQFLGLWALLRTAEEPASLHEAIAGLATAGALSFGLVVFFLVPYALESKLTFQPPGLGGVRFDFDQPHLLSILMPARRPTGHSGYLGLTLVLPGVVGTAARLRGRRRGRLAIAGCLGYAWLLALGHDLWVYDWIPFAKTLFFGGRYLVFVALFLSLGLGEAWRLAQERRWWSARVEPSIVALGALAVLLADLGGTTFTRYRHPYPAGKSGEARGVAFESIQHQGGTDLSSRALELPESPRDYLWSALLPLTARRATPAPGLWGTLRSGMYVFQGWVAVTDAWRSSRDRLPEAALDRLALFGVRTVLANPGPDPARTLVGPGESTTPRSVELGAAPGWVLAAPGWRHMSPDLELPAAGWERPFEITSTPPGAMDRIIDEMQIDRSAATARTLILRQQPPSLVPPSDARPRLVVRSTQVSPTIVTVDLDLDRGAYLRFAQSFYPHQRVFLDGHRIEAVPDVAYASVVVAPAGRHSIEFRGGWSPLRRTLAAASLAVLVLSSLVELRARRRPRSPS